MKTLSLSATSDNLSEQLDKVAAFAPSFALIFAAPSVCSAPSFSKILNEKLAGIPFIGCSTAGEILGGKINSDSASIAACKMEQTNTRFAKTLIQSASKSREAGSDLAKQLADPDLRFVIVLLPGLNVNGSAFVHGMRDTLGDQILISGGMAGDGDRFQQTLTFINGEERGDMALAVGFYGETVCALGSCEGGWRSFGPARHVTKAEGHVLYELDGKPALQLYREYLGEKAKALPASGLSYPFAILDEKRDLSGVIRAALDIDHEKGALILAGDMPPESWVCLMHADSTALTDGARRAAQNIIETVDSGTENEGLVLAISCIARRLVMVIDAEDETEAIEEIVGTRAPIVGFYSYGEIGPMRHRRVSELHNQTVSLVYLTEKAPM